MWRSSSWTALVCVTTLLAGGPAVAGHDDDWKERYYYGHKKKGKEKRKLKHEPGYYVYYIPRDLQARAMFDCPPPGLPPFAHREVRPPLPQAAPRAYGKSPDAFPKESQRERALARQRQRDILEKELATEQGLLALARRELAEEQGHPAQKGGEPSFERLRPYMDNVELHEKNVAALRSELAVLNR